MNKFTKNNFRQSLIFKMNIFTFFILFTTNSVIANNGTDKLKAAETEILKNLISKDGEGELKCHYLTSGNITKIKTMIKDLQEDSNSSASGEFKDFLKKAKTDKVSDAIFKTKLFCDHIAATTSSSRAKRAGHCRALDIFSYAQSSDCQKLGAFLSGKAYEGKKETFNRPKSKKITDTDSTCVAEGSITIDFQPCADFAKALTLWKAGQLVVDQGQQAWMMGETQTAMAEAQGKTDDPKAALGAMKTSAEAQSTVVKQKAALETAKLAHLVALYKKIPNEETVEALGGKDVTDPNYGVLLNAEVRDDFKAELVKIGGSAVAQMVMAKIADDRVDAIGNAMAKVDAFKPIDFSVTQDDALVAYCQQHPEEAKCLSGNLSYNVDPFSGDVIQFGGSGTGTTYSDVYAEDKGTTNAVNPTGSKTNNSLGPVGTTINGVDKANTIVDKSNSASLGDVVNPAGGGGGGGAAGGGGGFGGGSSPSGQKNGESVTAAGTNSKVSYSGGSGVSVLGNGLGIANRKSGKEESNPFDALLNKNKSNGNGVLNLRGPASVGKKDGNIFEQISTKYREVSSNKERLLEYQPIP